MKEAALILARQQSEYAVKDHGNDRSEEVDWHEAQHGLLSTDALGYRPVTFALGFNTREGEVLLADNFIDIARPGPFWEAGGHTYYGKNYGINCSLPNRGIVIAPPLVTKNRAEQRRAEAIGRRWVWPKTLPQRLFDWLTGQ